MIKNDIVYDIKLVFLNINYFNTLLILIIYRKYIEKNKIHVINITK